MQIASIDAAFFEKKTIPEPNSGCWLWTGFANNDGYGKATVDGKTVSVHRASYSYFCGEIPKDLHVLHKCDVRCCVNPSHLMVGTHEDNVRDCVEKGRTKSTRRFLAHKNRDPNVEAERRRKISAAKKGIPKPDDFYHGRRKLSDAQVIEIFCDKRRSKDIAKDYGVNRTTISSIKRRKTFARLTSPLFDTENQQFWG